MKMQRDMYSEKWTLLVYGRDERNFDRFNSKEELMDNMLELKEEGYSIHEMIIFPPRTSIAINEVVNYGVDKVFL